MAGHQMIQRDRSGRNLSPGHCACGKLIYPTKAHAKRAARQQPGTKLHPYRHGDVWHLTSQGYEAKMWYRTR